ncbi:hypothetical protein CH364_03975 [Leptospira harrisiae]|uniref:Uncharacterized protein n=1 Tax=Leptospira harrisiae TaxID=2023189 RepID=A0A2N0AM54_9LEPT|nr:hypothetical protein CH364_03975 [Leptospira harrisiae]
MNPSNGNSNGLSLGVKGYNMYPFPRLRSKSIFSLSTNPSRALSPPRPSSSILVKSSFPQWKKIRKGLSSRLGCAKETVERRKIPNVTLRNGYLPRKERRIFIIWDLGSKNGRNRI